jgi:maltooligosyltrehalose trehalohydrolase
VTGERDGYYKDFGEVASLAKSLANAFVRDGGFDHPRQRSHGRPPRGLTTDRFLSYIQNHDQIGNRAQGDRISASLDVETVKACAAVVLLSPFVPMLFQGEEWAASTPFQFFADHRHNGLADAVRDGRRAEFASFGWTPDQVPDPVAPETFKRSKLAWKEATESPNADVLDWHKRLIELRRTRSMSARSLEATRVVFDEERCWLAFRNADVIVACVFGEDPSARRGVGASDRHSAAGEESQRVTLAALLDAHETIDATPLLAAGSASVSVSDRHVHLSRPGCAVLGVALRGPS